MSEPDCDHAVENLYALLDDELGPELKSRVRQHFDACPECFPLFRFEEAFSRFLKARLAAREAHPDLRRRVFERLLLEAKGPETPS